MGTLSDVSAAESGATGVTERVVVFGSHSGLVGVLTLPDAADGRGASPRRAVVMANIGLMHRVGPYRLYVELARAVAALGWCALRFDLSGLGDSVPRTGAQTSGEQAQADVVEALDWLERAHGIREAVIVGLCSGVDSAHPVAVADPRVAGAVFVDGYTYPTAGFYVRRYTLRYLQLERWRRFGRRLTRKLATARPRRAVVDPNGASDGEAPVGVFQRDLPSRERFRDDIARVAARGARVLFIFTGTYDGGFNSPRQMSEILGPTVPLSGIEATVFRGADHLFSSARHRALFIDRVCRWLTSLPPSSQRDQ